MLYVKDKKKKKTCKGGHGDKKRSPVLWDLYSRVGIDLRMMAVVRCINKKKMKT